MMNAQRGGVGRRSFVKGGALALLGAAGVRLAHADALPFWQPQDDPPNQHNMLVVGAQTVFLSHLPMFHAGRRDDPAVNPAGTEFVSPHRFQVILEATFTRQGSNASGVYVKDRQTHPQTRIYTLEPNPKQQFVLSHLFTPAGAPRLGSFTGTVFRGHLEQGGQPIAGLDPSVVEIKRIVHARKFDPRGKKPGQLEYILFGKGPELFLSHAIFAPPDFDQVLSARVSGHAFTDSELQRDLRVTFPARRNVVADRLREGQKIQGVLREGGDKGTGTPIDVQIPTQFYFEEGELLVPATFDPTPEETKDKGPR